VIADATARARLAWWLGPWAPSARGPDGIERETLPLGGGSYLYRPTTTAAGHAWLFSPGMSPDGPDDPRVDRLARVVASTGAVVLSPRSPTFAGLRLGEGAIAELAEARALLRRHAESARLAVRILSPSIGSMAALHLAADPAAAIERTVLIGGYVDAAALTRSLCDADAVPRDPTNQPVAMATFVDHLPVAIADRPALLAAWRDVVRQTWAQPTWSRPGSTAHHPTVRAHVDRVAPTDRALFMQGCGLAPGGHALVAAALRHPDYRYLELRALAAAVTGELHAFHGPGDPVVPVEQLDALARAAPRARGHRLVGLDHGGAKPLPQLLASLTPRAVAAELRAFAALIAALAP
jgi:hypothetical protein